MGCFLHHRGVAQFGRVPALGAGCRRFESCRLDHFLYLIPSWENAFLGPVAQLGERSVRIREVESSNLFRSTIELYFLSADQKLWGFISMKNSAKALKIPKRGRSSAGSAKHPVCHPGKVEGITKFVQDAESVISMQKQYKKENQSSV